MDSGRSRGARAARLAGVTAAAALFCLAVAAPASAKDIGDAYSPEGLSLPVALALFVGIPLLGFLISALLAFRPQRDRARYRPGRPWDHETEWFGQPPEHSTERRRMALPHAGGVSGRW